MTISGTATDRVQDLRSYSQTGRTFASGISSIAIAVQEMTYYPRLYWWDGVTLDANTLQPPAGCLPGVPDSWPGTAGFCSQAQFFNPVTIPLSANDIHVGDSSGTWSYSMSSTSLFALPLPGLFSPSSYTVTSLATDRAGNVENVTSSTFTYDVTPPVSLATAPLGSFTVAPTVIAGPPTTILPASCGRCTSRSTSRAATRWCPATRRATGTATPGSPPRFISTLVPSRRSAGAVMSTTGSMVNVNSIAWDDLSTYLVKSTATDQAGNAEPSHGTADTTFDVNFAAADVGFTQLIPYHYKASSSTIVNVGWAGHFMRPSQGLRLTLQRLASPPATGTTAGTRRRAGGWTRPPIP